MQELFILWMNATCHTHSPLPPPPSYLWSWLWLPTSPAADFKQTYLSARWLVGLKCIHPRSLSIPTIAFHYKSCADSFQKCSGSPFASIKRYLSSVIDLCQNDFTGTLFMSFMQIESLVIKEGQKKMVYLFNGIFF